MKPFSYRDRDLAFGQAMLNLRAATGLTQAGVAEYLGVSRRAIGEWENGNTYPKAHHLKHFIELALKQQVFEAGREAEEIRGLWRAARQKMVLDEVWLAQVLASATTALPQSSNSAIASAPVPSLAATSVVTGGGPRVAWGDAPTVPAFYGREAELNELKGWVVEENCRVVSLLGLGGIGKSTLTVNLMHQVAEHFEVVIWRSLRDAPHCEALLDGCLQILAPEVPNETSPGLERRISSLLKHLQSRRVLLVLDNLETLLEEGRDMGYMREGYEGYDRLLRQIAETNHQSCMLLTSREKPVELVPLEGRRSPVRSLRLTPLDKVACEQLLVDKDTRGTSLEREQLSEIFSGNPLALKIVAQTIVDLFEGDIALFLSQGEAIFGGVKKLLDQQFARLAAREQTVLMWLAILREPATLDDLLTALVKPIPRNQLLEMMEALHRRSLIERGEKAGSFTLQSVVLEYLTSRLVEEVAEELVQAPFLRLTQHSLLQAQAKDYVRQSQQRVIMQPLVVRLKGAATEASRAESYLRQTLEQVRLMSQEQQGYAGGNILNFLIVLGSDLAGWDFSGLNLWQVYLAGVKLRDVNMAGADLRRSVFTQGFNFIVSIGYSPDGQYLAGGNMTGDIKVWQLGAQAESADYILHVECRGHTDMVISVCYSPDGQFLASGSHDHTVRLWDGQSGQTLLVLEGHTDRVSSVRFSPDGKLLASASYDGTIRVWRVATGEVLMTLEEHTTWVWSVAFSPDGRMVASGSFDGTIRLWEISGSDNSYKPVATLKGHQGWVSAVVLSEDAQTLYSCGSDSTIKVWSIVDRQLLQTLHGHVGAVQCIAISLDGTTLASGGVDRTVRLWYKGSDEAYLVLSGHTAPVLEVAFSPNGTTVASSSADRSIRLWAVERGETLATLQGHSKTIRSLAVSPTGAYLASTGSDKQILIWQLNHAMRLPTAPITPSSTLKGHTNQVFAVSFSPDGSSLASGGQEGVIRIWDLDRSTQNFQPQPRLTLSGHTDPINTIAFDPTSILLASGSADGTVRLWSTINGELLATLLGHETVVWTVAFSPDGRRLASGGNDGILRLWNTQTGQLETSLGSDKIPLASLAYQVSGELLAVAKYDGTIQVWQTADTTQPPLILKGHQGTVWSVAFSSDPTNSASLLSGGNDGTVRLWDIKSGEEVARFQYGGFVRSVAFTPDGTQVVSAGDGGLVKLWDIQTGELVATYRDFHPYEGVNITGATGLTAAQRATLLALGTVEN